MKFKIILIALMGLFTITACNSSDKPMSETMECCKEAADKGEKCAKCNHDEEAVNEEANSTTENVESGMTEMECCATAKVEGKTCEKCSPKKACCQEAIAEGKECAKCDKG